MPTYDLLIVGAGIIGCACAAECAAAGMRVGIVERGVVGGATTAAGMGHLVVMDNSAAQLNLSRYSRSLWHELRSALPKEVEYDPCGTIWVAADEEEMSEVRRKADVYAGGGVASYVLNEAELSEAEPHLRVGLAGGLLVKDDAVVYPPAAAEYLLRRALLSGADNIRDVEVVKVGDGLLSLKNGSVLKGNRILLATGADISLLPHLPIQKCKGHLVITDRHPGVVRHQLVELGYLKSAHSLLTDSVAFNIQPRPTGQLLIGSSRQYGVADSVVDAKILTQMLDRAVEYLPIVSGLTALRVWTGFRAATEDKLPLIGPTEDPTLFLAMGFEGLGITNAPGAARLVSDLLLGREPAIDARPFLPERLKRRATANA